MDSFVALFNYIEDVGAATNFGHFELVDTHIQSLSDATGLQLPILKYAIGLVLAFPLSAVMRRLPYATLKHLYSLLIGVVLLQWIFGKEWIHSALSSLVTYLICGLVPKRYVHVSVFIWVMGYMTACHGYRMYVSYMSGEFDHSGTQMVLTMKLTAFGYNLFDGTADRDHVFTATSSSKATSAMRPAARREAKMLAQRRYFAITSLPNPLEYFGYIYCFTCLLAGPAFEYNDYIRCIDGTAFTRAGPADKQSTSSSTSTPSSKQKVEIVEMPSSATAAWSSFFFAMTALVLHLLLAPYTSFHALYKPDFIAAHSLTYRWLYTLVASFTQRCKFYFAWKLAEAASVTAGFGFEGYDAATGAVIGWKGVENVDILAVETSTNVQSLTRNWNKRTQGWLERYTYHRTGGSLVATYFVSAFWHGMYPGYFLFFMIMPAVTTIERECRRKVSPLLLGSDSVLPNGKLTPAAEASLAGQVYHMVCFVLVMLVMNFLSQSFHIGSWSNCHHALGPPSGFYWLPHILTVVVAVLLAAAPSPKATGSVTAADLDKLKKGKQQ